MKLASLIRKRYRERVRQENPVRYERLFVAPQRRWNKNNRAKINKWRKKWEKTEVEEGQNNLALTEQEEGTE